MEIRRVKPDNAKKRRKSRDKENKDEEDDCKYLFVCNRWLARNEDDGQTVRELVPMDSTGTRRRKSSLAGARDSWITFMFQLAEALVMFLMR